LNLDASTLPNTTEQVLSNASFKDKSSLVGKSLREAGGYKKAVEVILKFKETTCI
jgi:UDP:flavonoid glycosyltransferase YjiC (YdhE family)